MQYAALSMLAVLTSSIYGTVEEGDSQAHADVCIDGRSYLSYGHLATQYHLPILQSMCVTSDVLSLRHQR